MTVFCNNKACKHCDWRVGPDINEWVCRADHVSVDWRFGAENWEPYELSCLTFEDKDD
jgi:hypothetical protein